METIDGIKYLSVGDVIELGPQDGERYKGAGLYFVKKSEGNGPHRILPSATQFTAFNSITNANTQVLLTLDETQKINLKPQQDQLFEFVYGVASLKGPCRVWVKAENRIFFTNGYNVSPDNADLQTAFMDEWESPFKRPSPKSRFYLASGVPPAFSARNAIASETIRLNIIGRTHIIEKVPEDSVLMQRLKKLEIVPIGVSCIDSPYKKLGGSK